jgi:hypothetical protein
LKRYTDEASPARRSRPKYAGWCATDGAGIRWSLCVSALEPSELAAVIAEVLAAE